MTHGSRIAARSHLGRLGILVVALGLVTAVPGLSRGEKPAGNEWIGQRVIPKHRDFAIRVAEGGPARTAKMAIYRVDQVKGGSLRLTPDGGPGRLGRCRAGRARRAGRRVLQRRDRQVAARSPQLCHAGHGLAPGARRRRARSGRLRAGDPARSQVRLRPRNPRRRPGRQPGPRQGDRRFQRGHPPHAAGTRRLPRSRRCPDVQSGFRRGHRRFQRGHPTRSQRLFDLCLPRHRLAVQERRRQGHGRLRRGHPPRPEERRRLSAAGVGSRPEGRIRPGHRRLQPRSSSSIPRHPWRTRHAARAGGTRRNIGRAIADFTEAIRLDPRNARAYVARGLTWRDQRQDDKAIADLDQAIALDPRNPDAYGVRGDAWADKKEFDKAIADFTRVIELDPRNAWAYASRGLAQAERQQYDRTRRRPRPGPPARARQSRRLERPRLVPGNLPDREVSRRCPGRRGGDQSLRGDRPQRDPACSTPSPPPMPSLATSTRP